jgi:hypothetical protein
MTVHTPAVAPRTDEELLIQEAIRLRQRDRSGRFLAGLVALAVFFGVVGYVMAFHSGTITYGTPDSSSFPLGPVLSVFGVVELIAAALLLVIAARQARSHSAWGDPTPGDCPVCGQAALRQDEVILREGNTLNTRAGGTVITCATRDCAYAKAEVATSSLAG